MNADLSEKFRRTQKGRAILTEIHVHPSIKADVEVLLGVIVGISPDGLALVEQSSMKVRMINQTAVDQLNLMIDTMMDTTLPILLTTDLRQEICIVKEKTDPTYLDLRKTQIEWKGIGYWLLAMRDVTSRVRNRQKLISETFIDELTGLYNRRGLNSLGEQALHLAQRENRDLLLAFIDLDGMKLINDSFGHKAGDKAITDVAYLLRQTFRKSDILVRLGGDEFAVIAQGKSHQDSDRIRRRLQEATEDLNRVQPNSYVLSLSIGFAHYDNDAKPNLMELIERADADMYVQKRAKKNSFAS
jgi:diguanylate cyclase (GGDEF)-like protein